MGGQYRSSILFALVKFYTFPTCVFLSDYYKVNRNFFVSFVEICDGKKITCFSENLCKLIYY